MTTRFFEDRLRLLSMGCRLSFTFMAASLDVVTLRVQTINNGSMSTCTGHFTAGEAIKFSDNRWVFFQKLPYDANSPKMVTSMVIKSPAWSSSHQNWSQKMTPTWLYHQHFAKFPLNRHYNRTGNERKRNACEKYILPPCRSSLSYTTKTNAAFVKIHPLETAVVGRRIMSLTPCATEDPQHLEAPVR
ncbi:hypothetical protein TNCV_4933241 [Trichonephila clavipes]|nr:hypothetical protein TNCV_4933241 [Trichonephila clavipes]